MSYIEAHNMHIRQRDHDQLNAEVQAFLARGGKIETIPPGQQTDIGPANIRSLTSIRFDSTKPAPPPATLGGRMLAILRTHGPQTTIQFYGWFPETTRGTVRATLNALKAQGRIMKAGKTDPWRLK